MKKVTEELRKGHIHIWGISMWKRENFVSTGNK